MTRRTSPPLKWHNRMAVVLMLLSLPLVGVICGGHWLQNQTKGVPIWKQTAATAPNAKGAKKPAQSSKRTSVAGLPEQVAFDHDWLGWIHAGAVTEGKYKPVYPKGAKL